MTSKTTVVFVDTNVYVATADLADSLHQKALALSRELAFPRFKTVTSSNIVSESLTVISQKVNKAAAVKFLEDLEGSTTEIIFVDEEIYSQALELFPKIKSKNVSFVDATSFAVMKNRGIKAAFTFDRHFKTQGFKLLSEVA